PSAETRSGRSRVGAETVAVALPGAPLGQERRARGAGDHVLYESVEGGPDGLRQSSGGARADRQRGDRGGVQGDREAAIVWLRTQLSGERLGGGGGPTGAGLRT